MAILLICCAGAAAAAAGHAPSPGGSDQAAGEPSRGPAESPGTQGAQPGQTMGNGSQVNGGQAGAGIISPRNFSGQPYSEWQAWASTYRNEPKYSYEFNFSGADALAGKNISTAGQGWFNASWDSGHSDISKKTARQRIQTILREMEMLKAMAAGSGLSAEEQASIRAGIGSNARWLNETDKDIQAAGSMKALGQAIAQAEPRMAAIRSEVKANAGLLACRNMDARLALAMNASDMANDRIQSPGLMTEEKARLAQKLADYDQHIYDACRYQGSARGSFQRYLETRDDACYIEGLNQIGLVQAELNAAFVDLKDIFATVDR